MSGQGEVKRNEIRRGLADVRRHLKAAEQAITAADATSAFVELDDVRRAAAGTQAVLQLGGRYRPVRIDR